MGIGEELSRYAGILNFRKATQTLRLVPYNRRFSFTVFTTLLTLGLIKWLMIRMVGYRLLNPQCRYYIHHIQLSPSSAL